MTNPFKDQKTFMVACDQTVGIYNKDQFDLYQTLIKEEVEELDEAIDADDRVEKLDALLDIMVVTLGALHSLGVDDENAWKEVISSNMSKIDADTGKVLKREDGKVIKPDTFKPPRLDDFFLD
jgi:predicted HAD superfamily Cof-like phosphohydrolase